MLRFSLLALALLAAGCATTQEPASSYPPVSPSEVVVYEGDAAIEDVEFEVVAFLTPPDQTGYGAGRDPIDQMKREAARRGANGLLIVTSDDAVAESRIRVAQQRGTSFNRTQYVAIRRVE